MFKEYANPGKLGNLLGIWHNIMRDDAENRLNAEGAYTEE